MRPGWTVRLALALGCGMAISGCSLDRRFVYFPEPWQEADWAAQWRLPLEDVWFEAADGVRLHGWWVEAPDSPAVLLWCHGNAGNIIHRLENLAELNRRGLSVFIFDYRGYGRSGGRPSEEGLYRDAEAAYDTLIRTGRASSDRLVLFGQSLGAAVAGDLATRRKAAGLILETPFPSVRDVVRTYYGPMPLHWLLRSRYDLRRRLRQVQIPLLIIHGDQDEVLPLALGRAVYDAALPPKDFYLIHGARHNDTYQVGGAPYFARLLAFVRDVTTSP